MQAEAGPAPCFRARQEGRVFLLCSPTKTAEQALGRALFASASFSCSSSSYRSCRPPAPPHLVIGPEQASWSVRAIVSPSTWSWQARGLQILPDPPASLLSRREDHISVWRGKVPGGLQQTAGRKAGRAGWLTPAACRASVPGGAALGMAPSTGLGPSTSARVCISARGSGVGCGGALSGF